MLIGSTIWLSLLPILSELVIEILVREEKEKEGERRGEGREEGLTFFVCFITEKKYKVNGDVEKRRFFFFFFSFYTYLNLHLQGCCYGEV